MSKWAKIYFRGGQQVSAGRVFEEIAFGKNMIGLRVPEFFDDGQVVPDSGSTFSINPDEVLYLEYVSEQEVKTFLSGIGAEGEVSDVNG
jgi:hypothetical protein